MNLGLVFESGDYVLMGVFLVLVLMSIITWSVIIVRALKLRRAKKGNAAVQPLIWNAQTLPEAVAQAEHRITHQRANAGIRARAWQLLPT